MRNLIICFVITILNNNGQNHIIPFKIIEERPIILLKINESEPLPFIFDTGASVPVISDSIFQILNLSILGKTKVGSPNNNQAIEANILNIDSIIIGEIKSKNLNAISFDFSKVLQKQKVGGIVGLSVFSGNLVSINYTKKELSISNGSIDPKNPNSISVNLYPIISFYAEIENKKYECHLDTGSKYYINIPYEWREELTFYDTPIESGKGRTVSGEFTIYSAKLKGTISIANISIVDPEINLITGGFNTINFGSKFIQGYRIIIDINQSIIQFNKI